ncbi:hypothetical protein BGZ54_007948 [Gamsiella multidivaricata]|nr:hypothetical protein BGZ54_007948 [Gamsiella multidivaricata]
MHQTYLYLQQQQIAQSAQSKRKMALAALHQPHCYQGSFQLELVSDWIDTLSHQQQLERQQRRVQKRLLRPSPIDTSSLVSPPKMPDLSPVSPTLMPTMPARASLGKSRRTGELVRDHSLDLIIERRASAACNAL